MSKNQIENIDQLLERIPTFSKAAQEAYTIIGRSQVDVPQLVKVLESEPSLVAHVLRVANSPFYGLSGHIKTTREACMVLGQYTLRNLILSAAVLKVMTDLGGNEKAHITLWQHCLHTAAVARLLASKLKLDKDASYTGGLLHDIGSVLLRVLLPEEDESINRLVESGQGVRDAERMTLGVDHAELAGTIAIQWNLPNDISSAIRQHHRPTDSEEPLVDVIHMADVISEWLIEDNEDTQSLLDRIAPEVVKRLNIDIEFLDEFLKQCPVRGDDDNARVSAA